MRGIILKAHGHYKLLLSIIFSVTVLLLFNVPAFAESDASSDFVINSSGVLTAYNGTGGD